MTKAGLAEKIYKVHGGLSKKEAYQFVDEVFSILKKNLLKGEIIRVSGFGTFKLVNKVERVGRNPQTGEKIMISPRIVINFKPSGQFADHVNKKKR